MRKNNKGITLIALIITIIVMLILVAVTIRLVINSDLLGTTQKTGEDYELAKAQDEIETDLAAMTIDKKYKNKGTTKTYYDYLVEKYGEENITTVVAGTRYQVNYKGHTIDVEQNGYGEMKLVEPYKTAKVEWLYEVNDDGTINITGIDFSAYKDSIMIPNEDYSDEGEILLSENTLVVPDEIDGKTVASVNVSEIQIRNDITSLTVYGIKRIIFDDKIKTTERIGNFPDCEEIVFGSQTEKITHLRLFL